MTRTISKVEARRFYDKFRAKQDRQGFYLAKDRLAPSLMDIQNCLTAAHAAMAEGGLFCHAGLTKGTGPVSRTTSALWTLVHRINPMLVGGCRPLTLADLMPESQWQLIHREVVVSAAIPSELVVSTCLR